MSAEIWAQVSKVAVFLKGFALNSTSSGEALTRLSDSHYDNQRAGAVTAQRRVTLACASTAGPHTINVGEVVIVHADGDTYRNIADGVTVYPSGANFLLFRPAGDGHACWQQMVDQGVLVRDFSRGLPPGNGNP